MLRSCTSASRRCGQVNTPLLHFTILAMRRRLPSSNRLLCRRAGCATHSRVRHLVAVLVVDALEDRASVVAGDVDMLITVLMSEVAAFSFANTTKLMRGPPSDYLKGRHPVTTSMQRACHRFLQSRSRVCGSCACKRRHHSRILPGGGWCASG